MPHDKFWELSWFEWSLYARRHKIRVREMKIQSDDAWARFRIQWADFRNANTSKRGKRVQPSDLIRLPIDDEMKRLKINKTTPDLEAVKKKFGPKLKKKKNAK